MRPAVLTFFLLGDLLAAVVAGALILADRTVLGIAAGVVIVVVTTLVGVRRLLRP